MTAYGVIPLCSLLYTMQPIMCKHTKPIVINLPTVQVVKVLWALGSLEAWLESVELPIKESSVICNPETMSVAEESSLLETEMAAHLMELHVLRQEVDHLHGHGQLHMQSLQARMEKLEQKYVFVL